MRSNKPSSLIGCHIIMLQPCLTVLDSIQQSDAQVNDVLAYDIKEKVFHHWVKDRQRCQSVSLTIIKSVVLHCEVFIMMKNNV